MLEDDYLFSCPYCGESLTVRLDMTVGQRQEFVYDCEVCCKPIRIRAVLDDGGVTDFNADVES